MDEKIEFEGKLLWSPDARRVVTFLDVDGRHIQLDAASGQRYRVTLEPVEPELKPCPFCGGEAEVVAGNHDWFWTWIHCTECHTDWGKFNNKADAIIAWNRRACLCYEPIETGAAKDS